MAHIEQAASAGFVDLHTHGIGGLDTESTDSGTMLAIAKAHGLAGVAEIVLSLYPAPIEIMRKRMAAVEAAMRRNLRGQARIAGVHLEGPFLNPAACGALDPALFLGPDEAVYRRLTEGYEGILRIVTVAPELPGAPGLIRRMARAGIRVNMGHSEATYSEAEAGFRAGARGITHLFNAMRPFHHRAPGIAGFGLLHRDVFVEVIGDLVHLHRRTLDLVFRVKDRKRIILVSDSVKGTPLPAPGRKSGAPVRKKGRLLGGSMTLPEAAAGLIASGFDRDAVITAATENPASYLAR